MGLLDDSQLHLLRSFNSFSSWQLAGLATAALLLTLSLQFVYRVYLDPLSHIPGPKAAAFSHLWITQQSMAGTRMYKTHELFKKYDTKLLRLGPKYVQFSDARALTHVYTKFRKSEFYSGAEIVPGHAHSMSTRETKDWSPIRKLIAPTYSYTNVASWEPELTSNVQHMISRIDATGGNGSSAVDILYLTRCVASDAVGLLAFGEDWGATKKGHSLFLQWIDGFTLVFVIKGLTPKWFLRPVLMRLPIPKLQAIFDVEQQFIKHTLKVLEPLKAQVEANPQIVDMDERNTLALRALGKEMNNGKLMHPLQVGCEAFGNVYAGTDTTSVLVSYALLRLSENPERCERLRKEVTEAAEDSMCADISTLAKLPYLNAVIHETLRTDGPANSSLERDVPEGGVVIDNTFIPEGTTIAAQGYTIHRNPDVFPQPDTWMPERWITTDMDQKKLMLSNFMPFGFSSRICAGQMLAWADMRLLIASIVKRYTFQMAPGQDMWMSDHFVGAPNGHETKMFFKQVQKQ